MYILVQKGQNDPYYVRGEKRAQFMKKISPLTYVLTSTIIMTGGLKREYYIRKRIWFFKFLTNF